MTPDSPHLPFTTTLMPLAASLRTSTQVPIIILGNELVYSKKQPMDTIMQMIREAHDKGFYVAMADIPPSYLDPDYAALWEV